MKINEHALSLHFSRRLRREGFGKEADHMVLLDERLRFQRKRNESLERRIDDLERHLDGEPVCV